MIDVLAEFQDNSRLAIEAGVVLRPGDIPNSVHRANRFWDLIPDTSTSLLFVVFLPERLDGALRSRMEPLTRHTGFVLLTLPIAESVDSVGPNRTTIPEEIAEGAGGNDEVTKSASAPDPKDEPESSSPKHASASQPLPPLQSEAQEATVRPEVLSDDAIASAAEDRLGFRRYAEAIYALIDGKNTKTPLTVAIHAPWGSGKTSLARLIEEQARFPAFGSTKPHKVFWFNAWLHDEGNAVHASFVSALARYCHGEMPWYWRIARPLSADILSVHERRQRRYVLTFSFFTVSLILLVLFGRDFLAALPNPFLADLKGKERANAFAQGGLLILLAAAIPFAYSTVTKLFTEIGAAMGAFVLDPKLEAQNASLRKVRTELSNLVRSALPLGSRLVVVVDDLERCRPPGCIDLLEGMSQLFEHQDLPIVFLVLADMTALSAAATVKYETLSKHYTPPASGAGNAPSSHHFGRMYLEKLITLQFDIPQVPHTDLIVWTNALKALPPVKSLVDDNLLPTLEWTLRCAQRESIPTRLFFNRAKRREYIPLSDRLGVLFGIEWLLEKNWQTPIFLSYFFVLWRLSGNERLRSLAARRQGTASTREHFGAGPIAAAGISLLAFVLLLLLGGVPGAILAAVTLSLTISAGVAYALPTMLRRARESGPDGSVVATSINKDLETVEKLGERLIRETEDHLKRRKIEEESQDSSDEFGLARETALKYVRSRPRSLKRMINRLRLAVYLTQGQNVDPVVLGKWTALQENWPGLASAIAGHEKPSDPVADLESGDDKKCKAALETLTPGLSLRDHLKGFLASEPKLTPKIGDLVRLSAS
ncbi:MAG: P-loop NTPase fold protein [Tagaea sp.]